MLIFYCLEALQGLVFLSGLGNCVKFVKCACFARTFLSAHAESNPRPFWMRFTPRQPTKEQPYLYDSRCLTNDVQQTCQHAAVPCMAFAFVCQGACALDLCCNCSFRPVLSNRVAEWHTTGTQRCDAIGPPLLIPNILST